MKRCLSLILVLLTIKTNLFAAEAGMPQLDPKYWASQAFWLILIFTILYISIAKFYLPKIKNNLDDRENKIKDDVDEDVNNSQATLEKSFICDLCGKTFGKACLLKMHITYKKF